MSDNVPFQSGTLATPAAGETIAADDVGGVKFQIVKLDLGAGGASDPVVGAVPVDGPLTDAELRATPVPVDGPLTDAELRAAPVPINGTVSVDNLPATQPISGTVTANAGTNLNTSALALEAGGNLAASAASLAVMDDWDESDRAKVNLIAGQAGITAGAGSVAANTPRVTHASDDPVVTALQIMDDWDNAASDGASVSGDVAHDSADAGEPVKIGGKALDLGSAPGNVAANDRTNANFTRNGVQLVLGGDPGVVTFEAAYTAAQTDAAIVSVSAGTAIVVTQIQALVDEACTVGVGLRVGFAAANTPTTTGVVLTHPGLVPGGGISRGDGGGILGIGASGEDLRITSEVPTGGSLRILVSYFLVPIG